MNVVRMPSNLFVDHCERYGYLVAEAMPCVVEQSGGYFLVDQSSGFFPVVPKPGGGRSSPSAGFGRMGPGTELHALLGRFGLHSSGDCKCTSRVAYMDKMEAEQPGWCAANIEEILGWLRESAAERGLPFVDIAARLLVKRAIANARRKEAARVATEAADRPSLRPEQ